MFMQHRLITGPDSDPGPEKKRVPLKTDQFKRPDFKAYKFCRLSHDIKKNNVEVIHFHKK